ncbi:myotubularin-related protein 3 [Cylas formicarius]|uniref:myotubularin-related protein 3 n=1 Tax=Cylas formicarius TaxID=197179 RepID=UPI0029585411|nr:myotubularin-related protein 3 [Cylas formicarius]XP_060533013.1 myotubularin-related protein 3 [Cylas formicarius]
MDKTDQPNSICHIQSIHMYQLQASDHEKLVPFALLTGETALYAGVSVDGLIVVTNYRLYVQNGANQHHIPLGLIEFVEIRELFYLHVFCKDARTYKCTFENNENALEWYDRISKVAEPPRQIEQLFAFYYCVWSKERGGQEVALKIENQKVYTFDKRMFESEMARLQFSGDSWRISKANETYKLCPTYPPYLLVPSCINDEVLESVSKFRSSRRVPAAVWRHARNGAVIVRCSQPEVGWLGWRSKDDEDLIKAVSDACNFDRTLRGGNAGSSDADSLLSHSPGSFHSDESLQIAGDAVGGPHDKKKVLIMDARSYTTAVANRARGGGCECPEYYPNCEIQFMNLANIHSIRKSFHALRQLCMTSADQPNWFSLLEGTRWLLHMSGLIKAAVTLAGAVERDARPVVVHCSDGWDRTPQIVALAELLLDPYYRTVDGFRVLIEREWLAFGHKFADRCGHSGGSDDQNERCPVFLQWLDCVHQLVNQFPVSFEFSQNYLIKLAQHTYSNLYGTFLCNSQKQRAKIVAGKTFTVWEFLNGARFRNHLYGAPTTPSGRVLWPRTNVRDLRLWSEVYLGSMEAANEGGDACPGPPPQHQPNMGKTRSYGDLMNADACRAFGGGGSATGGRRSSDPSVNREPPNVPPQDLVLNHNHDAGPDFLPSDLDDNPTECTQDCMFNGVAARHHQQSLTDDQIDCLDFGGLTTPPPPAVIRMSEITDHIAAMTERLTECPIFPDVVGGGSEADDADDDTSDATTTRSERGSKSDRDVELDEFFENNNNSSSSSSDVGVEEAAAASASCNGELVRRALDLERSVETSTETLVSEHVACGSSPKEYNGFEKIQSPRPRTVDEPMGGACDVCARSAKSPTGTLAHARRFSSCALGEDGLMPLRSPVQERLDQILEEQRRKVELLEKELHASRQILIRQACHKCHRSGDGEKHDDSGSVVESLGSTGEGQASAAGESLRSDLSWVAVEEGAVAECQGTLWVPDHAVSRCTDCGTEFWLGRRRHHCRKCGRIFCADCSENSTPLPSEQLYNPVRVCTSCYTELRETGGGAAAAATSRATTGTDVPARCKHGGAQGTAPGPHARIAASSN